MNDLISRQAAIDAADKIIERDTSGNNDVVKAMTAWKEYIEALPYLPSAQPEIIRCKDCKHRILNENYGKKGRYMRLKAMCDLDTGDPFQLGRNAEDDDWYCGDAERRTDETD